MIDSPDLPVFAIGKTHQVVIGKAAMPEEDWRTLTSMLQDGDEVTLGDSTDRYGHVIKWTTQFPSPDRVVFRSGGTMRQR